MEKGKRNKISQTKRQIIFTRDAWTCVYCGLEANVLFKRINKPTRLIVIPRDKKGRMFEIDHIIPISKGGDNSFNNLVTSCWKCNNKKSNKTKKPSYRMFIVDFNK